jgi:Helicase conserved C-terminal domain
MEYQEFLKAKARRHQSDGTHIDESLIHPSLHDWQKRIVKTSVARGRGAVFADTGMGKTRMQIEWARLIGDRPLILAPLSVARQTVREATKIDADVQYVRRPEDVVAGTVSITNYELAHHFDAGEFDAIALDESSILKNFTGATRTALIRQWQDTKHRSSWSATPAPNDVTELCNQAEFVGVMPRNEMLAAYFVHDDDGWRLKGHAIDPMFSWMATWAIAARRPSDVGGDDSAYQLPPLNVTPVTVEVPLEQDGQLFATDLGGVGGRARIRRSTLDARVDAASILCADKGQWIAWCGLNDESDALARNIVGAVNVHGTMSPDEKADAFEAFQDGQIRVLVTKPSIAGMGMNFQNCHQMVFVGLSDSWEAYYQAIRRCWRFGQTSPVDVHVVVSELEQQIVENIRRKETEVAVWVDRLVRHMNYQEIAQ